MVDLVHPIKKRTESLTLYTQSDKKDNCFFSSVHNDVDSII